MDNKTTLRQEYTKAVQELNLREQELREVERALSEVDRLCDEKRAAAMAAAGRASELLMRLNDDGE